MKLETLKPNKGAKHRKKRVGCGESSGHGKTSCRGNKGQKARTGHRGTRPGFEGGQMPMSRRLPKKGFNNDSFRKSFAVVNVGDLEKVEGNLVNEQALRSAGLVSGDFDGIKILGNGELKKKFTVEVERVSRGALEKITAAGGSFAELGKKAS
jgi:large subunit ribosomal protein L15